MLWTKENIYHEDPFEYEKDLEAAMAPRYANFERLRSAKTLDDVF